MFFKRICSALQFFFSRYQFILLSRTSLVFHILFYTQCHWPQFNYSPFTAKHRASSHCKSDQWLSHANHSTLHYRSCKRSVLYTSVELWKHSEGEEDNCNRIPLISTKTNTDTDSAGRWYTTWWKLGCPDALARANSLSFTGYQSRVW